MAESETCPISTLRTNPLPEMKKATGKAIQNEFILSAQRAFRRVARTLRTENARLGLPLIEGAKGRVKLVKLNNTRAE